MNRSHVEQWLERLQARIERLERHAQPQTKSSDEKPATRPLLVAQGKWAKELGISTWTFRNWRAEGRIPAPLDLPGWPRWERKTVERVTREIVTSGQGRYFRQATRRRQARREGHRRR